MSRITKNMQSLSVVLLSLPSEQSISTSDVANCSSLTSIVKTSKVNWMNIC